MGPVGGPPTRRAARPGSRRLRAGPAWRRPDDRARRSDRGPGRATAWRPHWWVRALRRSPRSALDDRGRGVDGVGQTAEQLEGRVGPTVRPGSREVADGDAPAFLGEAVLVPVPTP